MFAIKLSGRARRALAKLDPPARRQVAEAIESLRVNPRPAAARRLTGVDAWRLRSGSYRVIYQIQDEQLVVLVLHLGHRREVYRRQAG